MGADVGRCRLGLGGFALTGFYFHSEFSVILWGILKKKKKSPRYSLDGWHTGTYDFFFHAHPIPLRHLPMEGQEGSLTLRQVIFLTAD